MTSSYVLPCESENGTSLFSIAVSISGVDIISIFTLAKAKLSNAELLSQSDYIFTAKVNELVYTSPYAGGSAMLSVVKMFKGDGGMDQNKELMNLLVPQGLEVGKTYLFFRNKGLEGMPSRLNSIIDIEAPEYTAIYELLS